MAELAIRRSASAASGSATAGSAADFAAQELQAELVRQQFLASESSLRGMAAPHQQIEARIRRRAVHIVERVHQLGPVPLSERGRGQPITQALLPYRLERLRGEPAQPPLLHTLGAGIDGVNASVELVARRSQSSKRYSGCTISRPKRATPHFAETAQPHAACQRFVLTLVEMEKTQGQKTRAICDAGQELALRPRNTTSVSCTSASTTARAPTVSVPIGTTRVRSS